MATIHDHKYVGIFFGDLMDQRTEFLIGLATICRDAGRLDESPPAQISLIHDQPSREPSQAPLLA